MTPSLGSPIGATIAGKYRIEREIGRGAMGVVCEARHLDLGKRVAIKLIESSLAQVGEVAGRFRREARAASVIESDHVVQVFDVGVDDAVGLYMVMELLVGEDLCTRLERESMLDVETSVRIAHQIARALSKAHAAGVVHRDLKPANVFLVEREDGALFVKILDFGISKILEEETMARSGALKLTRAGTAVGTPQYSSPEQAQGFETVDHRTDVWSLGVLLYEMLSGRMAYKEMPTYEQFIIQLVTTSPEPLEKIAPWVPRDIAKIVDRALRHHLDERIADCATFAKMLATAAPEALGESGRHRGRMPSRPAADDTVQMDSMMRVSTPGAFEPSLPSTTALQEVVRPSLADLLTPDSQDIKTRVDASPFFDDDGEPVTAKKPPVPPAPPSSGNDRATAPDDIRRDTEPEPARDLSNPDVSAPRPVSGSGPIAQVSTVSRILPPTRTSLWLYVVVALIVACVAAIAWALLRRGPV
jgi:serine/threonine-protein kinase